MEYYFLIRSKARDVPWNWLNISKLGIIGALIIILAVDLAILLTNYNFLVYDVDVYTTIIKAITFVSILK